MGCCGQTRQPIRGAIRIDPAARPRRSPATERAEPARRRPAVYFEYTGRTGLTVFGPISGKRYRFNGNGAVVAVDPRDEPSVRAVPKLRALSAARRAAT